MIDFDSYWMIKEVNCVLNEVGIDCLVFLQFSICDNMY